MRIVVTATDDQQVRIGRGSPQSGSDGFVDQPGFNVDGRELLLQMNERVRQLLPLTFADLGQRPKDRITSRSAGAWWFAVRPQS